MKLPFKERRRFKRIALENGLLFADGSNLIGMAQVVDLSKSGVRCISMSPVNCTVGMMDNIELFGSEENLELCNLSGRMTRCSANLIGTDRESGVGYYEFGFEFFPRHYAQVGRLKAILDKS